MDAQMTYQPFQSEGRSKRRGIVRVDRRTREGKLLEQTRAVLTRQVGGNPNFLQCAIIERAAFLSVEAAKVNARIAAGTSTPADLRSYLALTRAIAEGRSGYVVGAKVHGSPSTTQPIQESLLRSPLI